MSEKILDEHQVRAEHLAEVRPWVRWALLGGVIGGGTILMLTAISALGSS